MVERHYLVGQGVRGEGSADSGPVVVELPSTSSEPPLPAEPPKRPENWVAPIAEFYGNDGLTGEFSFAGGMPPYTIAYGDGVEDKRVTPGDYTHEFPEYGSFSVLLTDREGYKTSVEVELVGISEPNPPMEGKPWDDFNRHVQFQEYWEANELGEQPANWDEMTIAQKCDWMDENVQP